MDLKTYTTTEVAERLGISRQTFYVWIKKRKIEAAEPITSGERRLWTESDLVRFRLAKEKYYGKGRTGRPTSKRR